MPPYDSMSRKDKTMEKVKKINSFWGCMEGKSDWTEHRGLLGKGNPLCDVIMIDVSQYTFVQTNKIYRGKN